MTIHREPATQHGQSKTIVVGLGVTGMSCVRHLAARGVEVAVADSREQPPRLERLQRDYPDVPVFLGPFDPVLLSSATQLIVSPGVAVATPAIAAAAAAGVEVIGDVELFVRQATAPIVAITGSNGKSTVTTLVGEMAVASGVRAAVGGNLGRPALELLDEPAELFVLELSSFQLETTGSLHAAVACVLNLSPDHMDRYVSLDAYAAAKARVFSGAGVGIFNADDPVVSAMTGADDRWTFTLGEARGEKQFGVVSIDGEPVLCRGDVPLLATSALSLPGLHNRANALAALTIGTALGLDLVAMLAVLQRFRGLPHRTELVGEQDGVRWFNDSKGTNVGATIAALQGLDLGDGGRTVLIAGGECKDADFASLGEVIGKCARAVVLIGRDAPLIAAVVPDAIETRHAESMDAAVQVAGELALPGDRVLLSPACASFDMFDGYAQRGERFVAAVRRYLA